MKKVIAAFIAGALVATVSSVYGESVFKPIKETVYSRADIKMTLNGELLQFENTIIEYDDKTFFPVRELANKLGATVDWDEQNQIIVLGMSDKEPSKLAPDEKDDIQMNINLTPESRIPKHGFTDVVQYQGKDYVTFNEVSQKTNGLYFHYNLEGDFTYITDENDETGNILIKEVPYKQFLGERRMDYDYYVDTILPLSR